MSYRGLSPVSRKKLSKRLDTVVKPRYDTECFETFDPCNKAPLSRE
ncbi:palindromic element RPE4 domain-containing protein [Rickettsia endosymbiont of Orchestes rusci]